MAPQPETGWREAIATQALISGLTELSSRAGHDLLGPLNQASALLALFIKRYSGQLDSEADQLLELLQNSSARMERVAGGIRKYMEIASRPPSFEPVDLNYSLASALSLLQTEISESGALVESETLPVLSADAAQVRTIFEILIRNAISFRRPEAPPRIQVRSVHARKTWGIAVADNGVGIEPEFRYDVFRPFVRLNGGKHSGAGLGLAIARLITAIHGGSIEVDNRIDQSSGTCLRFTLRPAS
jgi:light-regulated signal transduction histidine kinase (bacteriophytochrome)